MSIFKTRTGNIVIVLLLICCACNKTHKRTSKTVKSSILAKSPISLYESSKFKLDNLFTSHPEYVSTQFDFPVGKPDAQGYYNAQKFGENMHLGDDWNGTGGGNSDLGDAVYSISNGYVSSAENIQSGWGNVIRIIHLFQNSYYESLYAHCDTILVKPGQFIKRGMQIGTIGNANGIYLAHLHLEVRDSIYMGIGGGYSSETKGYLDPTKFIESN